MPLCPAPTLAGGLLRGLSWHSRPSLFPFSTKKDQEGIDSSFLPHHEQDTESPHRGATVTSLLTRPLAAETGRETFAKPRLGSKKTPWILKRIQNMCGFLVEKGAASFFQITTVFNLWFISIWKLLEVFLCKPVMVCIQLSSLYSAVFTECCKSVSHWITGQACPHALSLTSTHFPNRHVKVYIAQQRMAGLKCSRPCWVRLGAVWSIGRCPWSLPSQTILWFYDCHVLTTPKKSRTRSHLSWAHLERQRCL